jgi:hypothetical protein
MNRACRCIPGPIDGGEDRCVRCGKAVSRDEAEAERNRLLHLHEQREKKPGSRPTPSLKLGVPPETLENP